MNKLWVDDIRRPPDDTWAWARTNEEAIRFFVMHRPDECSLDHDMGLHDFDPDEQNADLRVAPDAATQPDGNALVQEMIELKVVPRKVTIHSWNPDGAKRMASKLKNASDWGVIEPIEVIVCPFDLSVRD